MINKQNKIKIEQAIDDIERDYQDHKGLILTEDDLKCILFNRLSNISSFQNNSSTIDEGITASFVHAELSWYGLENRLSIKPDITIINPRFLSTRYNVDRNLKLPSKQYSFKGSAFIFELKFIRQKGGISNSLFHKEILKDWHKIQTLFSKNSDNEDKIYWYFIIFSKSNKTNADFDSFLSENQIGTNHKIIFKSSNYNVK